MTTSRALRSDVALARPGSVTRFDSNEPLDGFKAWSGVAFALFAAVWPLAAGEDLDLGLRYQGRHILGGFGVLGLALARDQERGRLNRREHASHV
jgi:hypothetical protein